MRIAAIDLGTNTFHMIIVEIIDNNINLLFRKRHFVKLAKSGFLIFDQEVKDKCIAVVKEFAQKLKEYNVKAYKAYATSMFRRANNGVEFAQTLEEETKLKIEIIDGAKEALLIFNGVKMAGALSSGYNLIMDIGGGSVEFIIADKQKIVFDISYKIGILELYHLFSFNEPFNKKSLEGIQVYLKNKTPEIQKQIKKYHLETLVGTSGTFDVLKNISSTTINDHLRQLKPNEFTDFYNSIAHTSIEERTNIKQIPKERKKLIIYAFSLISFALNISNAKTINITSYSMKEGMIMEMLLKQ